MTGGLRAARWLVALHGITSFCYGMVLPYTAIFLSGRPGVGMGGVGLYYAASGAAGLVVAVVLASGWVRPPRVALGLTGNALSALGYLLLFSVDSLPFIVAAAAAVGAGQGCFMTAVIPIMNALVTESESRRMFALRYQVLNATLGAGSLAAGAVLALSSPDVIQYLFLVNAAGYVPIALALLLTRRASEAGSQAKAGGASAGTLPFVGLVRATLGVVLFELAIALFAYSQFESTAPLAAYKLMGAALSSIPIMIAVNVAVVVLAQPVVTRMLERRANVFGLRAAVALWVGGYLLLAASTVFPPAFTLPGLFAFAVMFGLGECAYSCSYYPWMISKVAESELTRVTALTNGVMGVGTFVGPSVGVALISTGSAAIVWLAVAALCSTAMLTTARWSLHQSGRGPAAAQSAA